MSKRQPKFKPIYANQWEPEKEGDTVEGIIYSQFQKVLTNEPVPFVQLVEEESGDIIEVMMGRASLRDLYFTGKLKKGYYLAIRYDGLSDTIEKAGNKAFMYSYYVEDEHGNEVTIPLTDNSAIIDPYNATIELSDRQQEAQNKAASQGAKDVDFEKTVQEQAEDIEEQVRGKDSPTGASKPPSKPKKK